MHLARFPRRKAVVAHPVGLRTIPSSIMLIVCLLLFPACKQGGETHDDEITDTACEPGAIICTDGSVVECDAEGTSWVVLETCGDDEICQDGTCLPAGDRDSVEFEDSIDDDIEEERIDFLPEEDPTDEADPLDWEEDERDFELDEDEETPDELVDEVELSDEDVEDSEELDQIDEFDIEDTTGEDQETCACSSGPCCDGCHFIATDHPCQFVEVTGFTCLEQRCAGPYYKSEKWIYCSGESAACDGLERHKPMEQGACLGGEICQEEGCVPSDQCQCECEEGLCCDGCYFYTEDTRCGTNVAAGNRCEGACGGELYSQTLDQFCSGSSPDCDGDLVGREDWSLEATCASWETCEIEGCREDDQICPQQCDHGACCDGWRFRESSWSCDTVGHEFACLDGTEPGADLYQKTTIQTCSGQNAQCDGELRELDWVISEFCTSDEYCDPEGCMPVGGCQEWWDCPSTDFYCRDQTCIRYEVVCEHDYTCPDDTLFCNTPFWACLPIDAPCEFDYDCTGHPAGEICDLIASQCINPPHCDVELNNCRPGTVCRELNELIGYQGNYCVECTSNDDCYEGLICENRLVQPDICRSP